MTNDDFLHDIIHQVIVGRKADLRAAGIKPESIMEIKKQLREDPLVREAYIGLKSKIAESLSSLLKGIRFSKAGRAPKSVDANDGGPAPKAADLLQPPKVRSLVLPPPRPGTQEFAASLPQLEQHAPQIPDVSESVQEPAQVEVPAASDSTQSTPFVSLSNRPLPNLDPPHPTFLPPQAKPLANASWVQLPPKPKPAKKPLFKILPIQNKEYSHPLGDAVDLLELKRRFGAVELRGIAIDFPQDTGLRYLAETERIIGSPKEKGRFTVRFSIQDRESGRPREIEEDLEVNPDADSLWHDIRSKENYGATPGWKDDFVSLGHDGALGRIIAARLQGKSHAHVGSPCDDDLFVAIQDGWHILVVADGAGSAKLSRLGSQKAVTTAGEFLQKNFLGSPQMGSILQAIEAEAPKAESLKSIALGSVGRAAYEAFIAVNSAAQSMEGVVLKDLSTTLLIGLARPLASGRWFLATFWIGDGALGLYARNKAPILFGTPDSGEYSGQTRFLDIDSVSKGLEKRVEYKIVEGFDALVLMTDGVSDPKFETEARLLDKGAWDEFWTDLDAQVAPYEDPQKASERLLEYLQFKSPGNHDDRTLAILLPKGGR